MTVFVCGATRVFRQSGKMPVEHRRGSHQWRIRISSRAPASERDSSLRPAFSRNFPKELRVSPPFRCPTSRARIISDRVRPDLRPEAAMDHGWFTDARDGWNVRIGSSFTAAGRRIFSSSFFFFSRFNGLLLPSPAERSNTLLSMD